tara:strand:+ start:49357 stop:50286 length:930 start_codon:yes stop_codon:yes gene_type:complete
MMQSNSNLPAMAIDFEATDASPDAQATQIGYCSIAFSNKGILNPTTDAYAKSCRPDRDISYGAMAVTGICPEDLEAAESHEKVLLDHMPYGAAYIIGHNIDYDLQVARNSGVDTSKYKSICTLAIARHLYPDADHKLAALLYRFDYDYARQHAQNAHSAAHDVRFCVRLLRIFCREAGITDMQSLYEFSEMTRIPTVMTFGKEKGKKIKDLAATKSGRGYFFYLISEDISDPYLLKEFQTVLTGTELECTKGNKNYDKGRKYKIDRFVGNRQLVVRSDLSEDVLNITSPKNLNLAAIDAYVGEALFKPA